MSLLRGGGLQDHSLPPIIFQPLHGEPGSVTRRDPRLLPTHENQNERHGLQPPRQQTVICLVLRSMSDVWGTRLDKLLS